MKTGFLALASLPFFAACAVAVPTLLDTVSLAPGENAVNPERYALNPVTHRLYVLGGEVSTYHARYGLKAIDTTTAAVVGGNFLTEYDSYANSDDLTPEVVAVDSGNNMVYVLGTPNVYGTYDGLVRVIDGATGANVTNTGTDLKIPGLGQIFAASANVPFAVNPVAHKLCIPDGYGHVIIIDGPSRTILGKPDLGLESQGVPVVDDVGNKVIFLGDGRLAFVDGATDTVNKVELAFRLSGAAAIDAAHRRLYVLGADYTARTATLYALNADTGAVLSSTTTGVSLNTLGLAFDPAAGALYGVEGEASGFARGNTVLFDPATLAVKGTFPHEARFALADSGKVFLLGGYQAVTTEYRGAVGVLDPATGAFSKTVTGYQPGEMAVNTKSGQVFVYDTSVYEVTVIDAASRAVVHRFLTQIADATGGGATRPIAVSSSLNRFYLMRYFITTDPTNLFNSTTTTAVDVYDGGDGHLIASVPVANYRDFGYLAIDDAHGTLFVTTVDTTMSSATTKLAEIDLATNTVRGTFEVGGSEAQGIAVNPVTQRVYVSSGLGIGEGEVAVFDAVKGKTIATVMGVGSLAGDIAINTKTNTIYVKDNSDGALDGNKVSIIDGATNTLKGTFTNNSPGNDHNVSSIAVDEVTDTVYVTDQFNGQVPTGSPGVTSFFDAAHNYAYLGSVTLGYTPTSSIFEPKTRRLFAANIYDGTVSVLQETGGPVVTPPPPAGMDVFTEAVNDLKVTLDEAGGKYKVKGSYTLKNQSAAKLKQIPVGVYLSTSATVTLPVKTGDPALLQIPVTVSPTPGANGLPVLGVDLTKLGNPTPLLIKKIKGGATYTADFKFKVPAAALQSAAQGEYRYVIVVADPGNQFADGVTTNNVFTVDLQTAAPN